MQPPRQGWLTLVSPEETFPATSERALLRRCRQYAILFVLIPKLV